MKIFRRSCLPSVDIFCDHGGCSQSARLRDLQEEESQGTQPTLSHWAFKKANATCINHICKV